MRQIGCGTVANSRVGKIRSVGGDKKMKRYLGILCTLVLAFVPKAQSQTLPMQTMSGLLNLAQTIPLPTEGYMDHMTVDVKGQRLFLCGENSYSLVVVDLRAGKVIHVTKGLPAMPKKPFYIPETDDVWLSLTDASVIAVSGKTYEITHVVKLAQYGNPQRGADNAAYDPATHLFYAAVEVFSGEVDHERPTPAGLKFNGGDNHQPHGASIDIVDTKNAKLVESINLPRGHPPGVALEPSGRRIYISMGNIIDGESHVAVVDLEKHAVVAQWPITDGPVPHTAGLDPTHHRLFVGSRIKPNTGEIGGGHHYEPGKPAGINTGKGKELQTPDTADGPHE